jgi:HEAT repeat protein
MQIMGFQEFKEEYLKATGPEEKISILNAVGNLNENGSLNFFTTQYKNESDGKVRAEIINYLSNYIPKVSNSLLIEALSDNSIEARKMAVVALGKQKNNSSLIPLMEMLNNPSLEIRDDIINSVVNIGKLGNQSEIIEFYDKGNIHIKRSIPFILGRIQNEESTNFLKELLHKTDPEVRRNAVQALEKSIKVKDARLIINLLEDIDMDVKKASIKALGIIKGKRAVDPLLILLKHKEEEIRNLALQSLKHIYLTLDSYEKIYEIAKSKNMVERREAIKLLGLLKDKKSIKYMINSFKSKDSKVRKVAYNSLIKICGDKIPYQVFEGLKVKESKVRSLCAKLIGRIGSDQEKFLLLGLLNDPDNKVRETAIDSLSRSTNHKVIEEVKSLLNSPNWKTRRAAVKLLIKLGTEESLEVLMPLINDNDLFIKSWIALALGKLENINDISPFIDMLKDRDPKIRIASARALSQIGNREALKALSKSLWDDNWDVRKEVEMALNKIDPNWLKNL